MSEKRREEEERKEKVPFFSVPFPLEKILFFATLFLSFFSFFFLHSFLEKILEMKEKDRMRKKEREGT